MDPGGLRGRPTRHRGGGPPLVAQANHRDDDDRGPDQPDPRAGGSRPQRQEDGQEPDDRAGGKQVWLHDRGQRGRALLRVDDEVEGDLEQDEEREAPRG